MSRKRCRGLAILLTDFGYLGHVRSKFMLLGTSTLIPSLSRPCLNFGSIFWHFSTLSSWVLGGLIYRTCLILFFYTITLELLYKMMAQLADRDTTVDSDVYFVIHHSTDWEIELEEALASSRKPVNRKLAKFIHVSHHVYFYYFTSIDIQYMTI